MIEFQAVTHTAYGLDGVFQARHVELGTQVGNVDIYHGGLYVIFVRPDVIDDVAARQRLAGVAHQVFKQAPFSLGEVQALIGAPGRTSAGQNENVNPIRFGQRAIPNCH